MKLLSKNTAMLVFILIILILAISDIYIFDAGSISSQLSSSKEAAKPMELAAGWQYKWGDSGTGADGKLIWLHDGTDSGSSGWTDFTIPWSPSNTHKFRQAWLRTILPEESWHEPALLFRTYEQSIRVYLEKDLIYEYGSWDNSEAVFTLHSPWHMVALPDDFQGRTLYFRIHSNSPIYTGDREEVIIGSKSDLTDYRTGITAATIRQRADSLILSFLFVFIGFLLAFTYFLRKSEGQVTLPLGFFSICIGVWIFTESSTKFLFLDAPIVWLYTGYISCQLLPVGFCSFVIKVFGDTEQRLIQKCRLGFYILLSANLLMDVFDILPWSVTIRLFHLLLVLTILVVLHVTIKAAKNGDQEANILAFSFIVLSLFGIYDMVDRFYMPISLLKGHHITQWAMFVFTMSLIYIVLRRFWDTYDKLKLYSKEIEDKNEKLESMWLEVNKSRNQIEEWNKGLEQIVMLKTRAVKNLLDNAGQGFLTFGRDLLIDKEYSLECISIFGEKIENRSFPKLICSNDEERKYLELTLLKILTETNASKQEIYFSLLPDEIEINDKNISLQYKVIDSVNEQTQKVFMVVLTDITEKRALENKVENERKTLRMVVKAVTDHNEFTRCLEDFQNFCSRDAGEILEGNCATEDKLFEIYRKIHTFKGNFAQMDMVNIVDKLHDFEEALSALRRRKKTMTTGELKSYFSSLGMEKWLDADMSVLKDILGESFFDYEKVLFIDQVKLLEIENKMTSVLSQDQLEQLLPAVKGLRFRPFRELFAPYPRLVSKLSAQMEKAISVMDIEGGEMLVDTEKYSGFSRSLVHVFKNMVDHGIETPDERIESGKKEHGSINCRISLSDRNISLVISDDGRGIDVNGIKSKAVEYKLLDPETAAGLCEYDALQLVFLDGITTKKSVNRVSGRGVGLAAVKSEVEKIGGTIEVKSKYGLGTEFYFQLPFEGLPA